MMVDVGKDCIPVPPPVTRATIPSTENKAAGGVEAMGEGEDGTVVPENQCTTRRRSRTGGRWLGSRDAEKHRSMFVQLLAVLEG